MIGWNILGDAKEAQFYQDSTSENLPILTALSIIEDALQQGKKIFNSIHKSTLYAKPSHTLRKY